MNIFHSNQPLHFFLRVNRIEILNFTALKLFLKIGLPWICSLAAIFYLGLELGSSSTPPKYSVGEVEEKRKNPQTSSFQPPSRENKLQSLTASSTNSTRFSQ